MARSTYFWTDVTVAGFSKKALSAREQRDLLVLINDKPAYAFLRATLDDGMLMAHCLGNEWALQTRWDVQQLFRDFPDMPRTFAFDAPQMAERW
jgi:hypothetical protein